MAYQITELQQPSTICHGNSDAFSGHAVWAKRGELQKRYASDLFFQLLHPCTKTCSAPLVNHAKQVNTDSSAVSDWIGPRETGWEKKRRELSVFYSGFISERMLGPECSQINYILARFNSVLWFWDNRTFVTVSMHFTLFKFFLQKDRNSKQGPTACLVLYNNEMFFFFYPKLLFSSSQGT